MEKWSMRDRRANNEREKERRKERKRERDSERKHERRQRVRHYREEIATSEIAHDFTLLSPPATGTRLSDAQAHRGHCATPVPPPHTHTHTHIRALAPIPFPSNTLLI